MPAAEPTRVFEECAKRRMNAQESPPIDYMRKFSAVIKDFLKAISCCQSSCMNQTIDQISEENLAHLMERMQELTEIIHALRSQPQISAV